MRSDEIHSVPGEQEARVDGLVLASPDEATHRLATRGGAARCRGAAVLLPQVEHRVAALVSEVLDRVVPVVGRPAHADEAVLEASATRCVPPRREA